MSGTRREIESGPGDGNASMLRASACDSGAQTGLGAMLQAPRLYDEFLCYAAHAVPAGVLDRDGSQACPRNAALLPVFKRICEERAESWSGYHMCEWLVGVEESFQPRRFRRMDRVGCSNRHRRGTGGSSGVDCLKKLRDLEFFRDLLDVRTMLV